jgi:GNAT superfamily N-acetyltransferase
MSLLPHFRPYRASARPACLDLFDANCPAFFDPGERPGYVQFLDGVPEGYEVCLHEQRIVGAYGVRPHAPNEVVIRWMLIAPDVQGMGVGSAMMDRALSGARATGARLVHMAASHKSAPFFARFGARATATIQHGWGPNLHRVDMELVP